MNHGAKPFDGVALGLVGATMLAIEIPWLLGLFAFLACWTDERAVVALGLIGLIECCVQNRLSSLTYEFGNPCPRRT